MRLKAEVTKSSGKTRHYVGKTEETNLVPIPAWIEIVESSEGFYLLHYNSSGECIADTWHSSVFEAKEQADFEFSVKEKDWIVLSS